MDSDEETIIQKRAESNRQVPDCREEPFFLQYAGWDEKVSLVLMLNQSKG